MSRWSPVYVPEIETGRHVKNNACTVEIKIKWMIRKHMTYENTYRDDNIYFDKSVYRTVIQANFKVAIHLAPLEVIGWNRNSNGRV